MKSIEEQLEVYENQGFDIYQLEEIRFGLESNLDVSIYAKHEFDADQMWEIRLGLLKGIDVSIYAKEEFNHNQMFEIRLILLNKDFYRLEEYGFEKADISQLVLEH